VRDEQTFGETEQRLRERARALGLSSRSIERLALSPTRALACVEATIQRGGKPGLAVRMFDDGDDPHVASEGAMTSPYAVVEVLEPNAYGGERCIRRQVELGPAGAASLRRAIAGRSRLATIDLLVGEGGAKRETSLELVASFAGGDPDAALDVCAVLSRGSVRELLTLREGLDRAA